MTTNTKHEIFNKIFKESNDLDIKLRTEKIGSNLYLIRRIKGFKMEQILKAQKETTTKFIGAIVTNSNNMDLYFEAI